MKAIYLASLLYLISTANHAQAPSIEWQKTLGGSNQEYGYCVRQTTDGGYIVAGESVSPEGGMITDPYGSYDCWVVKLNPDGGVEWQKSLGGSDYDRANAIEQTPDGGYIMVGMTYSNNFDVTTHYGGSDVWVVKLSSTGILEWQKALGGSNEDEGFSVQPTTDGGYIVSGFAFSTNGVITTVPGGWIAKLDNLGAIQWQKSAGNRMHSVRQTADGGYVAAGFANGPIGGSDYHIVKLNSAGTTQWQKYYGGTSVDVAASIEQTTDGGYVVGGTTNSSNTDVTQNNGTDDYWVLKLNSLGNLEWQKALGGSTFDEGKSVQQTADGGFVICGKANSNNGLVTGNHGAADFWVVKLDSAGSLTWQKSLGGSGTDWGQSIRQTIDGGYIVAGSTGSFYSGDVTINYGDRDFWVVKLGPENLGMPHFSDLNAVRAYPNPVQDFIQISNVQDVKTIALFDLSGRKVHQQHDVKEGGIAVQDLPKGVYLLQISLLNGETVSEKMIKE